MSSTLSLFEKQIYENFKYNPTEQQKSAFFLLSDFLEAFSQYSIFVLGGYAGTGKTSIIASLVLTLQDLKIPYRLLASTGRAAKIMEKYSGHPAYTIHKTIYRRQTSVGGQDKFSLNYNKDRYTVYIVDEVSMLSDNTEDSIFGTGNVMSDFFEFVNSSDGNIVIFVGDSAQLPPVGYDTSPALSPSCLSKYVENISAIVLNEVMRQTADSNILNAATDIRTNIEGGILEIPRINLGKDVMMVDGRELIDSLQSSYSRSSIEQTVIITRSNARAVKYNLGVRQMVRYLDEGLSPSDMLMIVKNNYGLAENMKDAPFDFIANGDIIIVDRVIKYKECYGFKFAYVSYYFPDYDEFQMESWIMLDTLTSQNSQLTGDDSLKLYNEICNKYKEQGYSGTKLKQKIKEDEFFNALQVKYAYAVTCHKSQGGQWEEVYIDNVLPTVQNVDIELLRWLYTAITRAKSKLFFINWSSDYFNE